MINFSLKSLIYKQLHPIASLIDCKLLVVDYQTYRWKFDNKSLFNKIKHYGIDTDNYDYMLELLENYGCIVILKSYKQLSNSTLISHFSKFGLENSDINILNSINDDMLDKTTYFYWFPISISDCQDFLN